MECARFNELGPAGIDQQRVCLHSSQVGTGDAGSSELVEPQMQGQDIGPLEERCLVGGGVEPILCRPLTRRFATPYQHRHTECIAVTGDALTYLAVAPDTERQTV